MIYKLNLLLFLLFTTSLCQAQTGRIEGYIQDADAGFPLSGASVAVTSAYNSYSDEAGKFRIDPVPAGKYELIITYIGYKTAVMPVEVVENVTTTINTTLRRSGLDLKEVQLNSSRQSGMKMLGSVDILLRPVNNSQDVLRIVPGLFIAQHAGGGKAEQIFLRGFDIDHGTDIRITVDDMPVNMVSHAHGQGYADLHFLIPETIEKTIFDKGPYQPDQGNQATAGYVSFKTKDFIRGNLLKVEAGLFSSQRLYGQFKLFEKINDHKKEQFYIASEYFKNKGFFESPQNFHRFNILGKYNLWKSNQSQLTLTASAFDSKWFASGQIPERAVQSGLINRFGAIDDSEGGNTSRVNAQARYFHRWKNNWETTDMVYYSRYQFNLYSNFTFFLNDPVNGDGINQRESRDLFGYQGTMTKTGFLKGKRLNSRIGYGFRSDRVQDIELANSIRRAKTNSIQKGDIREDNAYAFIDEEIRLNNRWRITAGLRFDYLRFGYRNQLQNANGFEKQDRSTLNPSLRFQYTHNANLSLFLNAGTGFHSNDTRVILDNSAREILPKVYGTDLGIILKPAPRLLVQATAWYLLSEQEFVYVGDAGIIEPGGKTRRLGLDLMTRYQLNTWLFTDMDLNLTRARSVGLPKEEAWVPLAAAFTSVGGLTAKNKNGMSASLRYRWITARPANEDNSVRTEGYFLLDALLQYEWKKFTLFTSVENLLNIDWREAQFDTESRLLFEPQPVSEIHYTPGTPFFLRGGLSIRF